MYSGLTTGIYELLLGFNAGRQLGRTIFRSTLGCEVDRGCNHIGTDGGTTTNIGSAVIVNHDVGNVINIARDVTGTNSFDGDGVIINSGKVLVGDNVSVIMYPATTNDTVQHNDYLKRYTTRQYQHHMIMFLYNMLQ